MRVIAKPSSCTLAEIEVTTEKAKRLPIKKVHNNILKNNL